MKTVAIAGVGLIGGSFGLALRKAGFTGEILGVSSKPALEAGLKLGAISAAATLEEAAKLADLIYLAQPVDRILHTLARLGPIAPSSCLITDAGSTKAVIVRKASDSLRFASFLGGHPMAGKERRGAESADAELFSGRPYVLTPDREETDTSSEFRNWLARMGANVLDMPASEHDAVVAFTSHLPQLISTALSATLAEQRAELMSQLFGPGLLDMTRLALSSPELWRSIIATNKAEILSALDIFADSLCKLRNAVSDENISQFFCTASTFARIIREPDCIT